MARVYYLKIMDLIKKTIFEKEMSVYEYSKFERKCRYSKKIKIISAMKMY